MQFCMSKPTQVAHCDLFYFFETLIFSATITCMTNKIDDKFLQPYDAATTESRIYSLWEKSGYFNPDNLPTVSKEAWCTIMPPPNANGRLHAGHGLDMTIKDILTRFKRMQGYKTLFLPGADHAGFETQIVYEKKLEKEGRSRMNMEPQELYDEIFAFTHENKKYMEADVKRLGTSCDWSREKFTLDDDVVATVHNTFQKMFDDGLAYRGHRIVNWCTKHQTSLSDVETEFVEQEDKFYYLKYGPFTIGTSRPETKFGDKYVVMHPDDTRYAEYTHGQSIELEWINGPITATILKDEAIDMEFGTGVMTITPWHDQTDFEIAERHNLEKEQIIDWYGKLLPIAGEFEGMKIADAREKIITKLTEKGLLVKTDEKYVHNIKVCYKCNRTIEPQIKDQWFIKMDTLAEKALEAVTSNETSFVTEQFEKTYKHWMNNPIDWNISRQIVWGITIPAKICTKCDHGVADTKDTITACQKCKGPVVADTDTFDTWFSSGQWPLVTLNYPDGDDFKTYYPTQLMETGKDLVFKWIPRMVMFGKYLDGRSPFKDIYLHGMINDEKNMKMSKSKGNVMSPVDLIDEFGADALRMSLIIGNTPGNDMALSKDKIRAYRKFSNKLWNIARFVQENTKETNFDANFKNFSERDTTLRKEQTVLFTEVTKEMEAFKLYIAAEKLYHYTWDTFAAEILEASKTILEFGTSEEKESRQQFLLHTFDAILKMLHPFMPFITEEIFQSLPHTNATQENSLMVQKWPIIIS